MKSWPIVLLFLLWSVVRVYSRTFPYILFMEEALPNHTYVDFNRVGNITNGSDSVQCHTDLEMCCSYLQDEKNGSKHRGNWIPPGSDDRLPYCIDANPDVYECHENQRVDLRRGSNATMPSGIYRCINPVHDNDDITVRESVYVGLYASGGDC